MVRREGTAGRTSREPAAGPRFELCCGDAEEVLAGLAPGIASCVVTSPPYFGHRAYSGDADPRELGREPSAEAYVARLARVLAAAREVLAEDGTLWLNLGDTYRRGELLGIPWRVALALKAQGWRLRADVIWHKPNAMPSSVKSRPTVDHEYLFLFSRSERYRYDADAIREPHVTFTAASRMRGGRRHLGVRDGTPERGKNGGNPNLHTGRWDQAFHPLGRNKRTVWSVPLGKFRGAHFAVFPERLVEPCILAGCPPGGLVLDPFAGAGTTGVVSLRLGRRFLGVELVPDYVALVRDRLEGLAGSAVAAAGAR
jgi:site-specific DNA-methyltransferase (adenine-specific)